MRLLITHNGIMKVFPNATQYPELINFIHQNFPTVRKNQFSLNYLDSDGDMVSLGSQMDLETMQETISSHYVKVFLKDQESDNQIIVQQNKIEEASSKTQPLIQDQEKEKEMEKVQKVDNTPDELPISKTEEPVLQADVKIPEAFQNNQSKLNANDSQNHPRCGGGFWNKRQWFGQMNEAQCEQRKRQWKEKWNEQIAKKVDDRIETLLPLIVKKVQQSMSNQEIKVQNVPKMNLGKLPVSVHKNVKCNLCWVQPIVGIRYKCLKCPAFNLCSQCEPKADHNHNMVKMKYEEDPQIKIYERPFKLQKVSDCNMRDPKFALTKKCFKLASIYGGQPQEYIQFVNDHLYESVPALVEKYREQNKVSFSQRMGAKLQNLAKKLAFYFNKKAEEFMHLVQQNPNMHFKGLLRKAQEEQQEAKLVEEISKIEKQKSQVKIQEQILKKGEYLPVQIPKVESYISQEIIKVEPKQKEGFGIFSIKSIVDNPVKRNQVVLRLKDIFGEQKQYEFLEFYNQYRYEEVDQIVDGYIKAQFK